MAAVSMMILRVVDDDFPTWVECELTDRFGRAWRIIDKLPSFEAVSPLGDIYPRAGTIVCQVIGGGSDDQGRAFVHIDTGRPHGVQSVEERTQFQVFAEQITE